MKTPWRKLAALVLIAGAALGAAPAAPSKTGGKPAGDGWPATPAGAMGRGWVQAYAGGDSAMRAFYTQSLHPDSLARRSADQRLSRYHTMREEWGTLMLGTVLPSTPSVLNVTLIDAEAESHEFIFTVAEKTPNKLLSVAMKQRVSHGFGGFHH